MKTTVNVPFYLTYFSSRSLLMHLIPFYLAVDINAISCFKKLNHYFTARPVKNKDVLKLLMNP